LRRCDEEHFACQDDRRRKASFFLVRSSKTVLKRPASRPSIIDDLSTVVTASDTSERGTKWFAVDHGRKRCQVFVSRNSAGATQNRGYEFCIEIRQARPKSAREILRQCMIGMLLVFGSAADLVHMTNHVPWGPLGREALHDVGMFLGNVKPVERIEQHEA